MRIAFVLAVLVGCAAEAPEKDPAATRAACEEMSAAFCKRANECQVTQCEERLGQQRYSCDRFDGSEEWAKNCAVALVGASCDIFERGTLLDECPVGAPQLVVSKSNNEEGVSCRQFISCFSLCRDVDCFNECREKTRHSSRVIANEFLACAALSTFGDCRSLCGQGIANDCFTCILKNCNEDFTTCSRDI